MVVETRKYPLASVGKCTESDTDFVVHSSFGDSKVPLHQSTCPSDKGTVGDLFYKHMHYVCQTHCTCPVEGNSSQQACCGQDIYSFRMGKMLNVETILLHHSQINYI